MHGHALAGGVRGRVGILHLADGRQAHLPGQPALHVLEQEQGVGADGLHVRLPQDMGRAVSGDHEHMAALARREQGHLAVARPSGLAHVGHEAGQGGGVQHGLAGQVEQVAAAVGQIILQFVAHGQGLHAHVAAQRDAQKVHRDLVGGVARDHEDDHHGRQEHDQQLGAQAAGLLRRGQQGNGEGGELSVEQAHDRPPCRLARTACENLARYVARCGRQLREFTMDPL